MGREVGSGREGREGEGGGSGREGREKGRDVEGPGKWSAPGPTLALSGPAYTTPTPQPHHTNFKRLWCWCDVGVVWLWCWCGVGVVRAGLSLLGHHTDGYLRHFSGL